MKSFILAGLTVPAMVATVPGGPHAMIHHLLIQKLDLTQEQQTAIQKIMEAHHPALKTKGQAVFQARADLIQALTDPQTTEDQIRAMEAQASAAHLAMELEISQVVKEVSPILTPEQRVKARDLVKGLRSHIEGFRAWVHGDVGK